MRLLLPWNLIFFHLSELIGFLAATFKIVFTNLIPLQAEPGVLGSLQWITT